MSLKLWINKASFFNHRLINIKGFNEKDVSTQYIISTKDVSNKYVIHILNYSNVT